MAFDPTTARPAFDPESARPARMNPSIAAQGASYEAARESTLMDELNSREPGIDYATGIPSANFRAGFSRMSNDAEKANYLDRSVGKGRWGQDRFGAYYLRPEAAAMFGIKTDKPVALDEQTVSRYDVADIAGSAPSILGAVGGGIAASGAGLLPGLGMAGLGAAGGKAFDEIIKNVQGLRQRPAGDIAADIAGEGALGALGEGTARALFPIGSKILGPGASRMTPEKRAMAQSAIQQGFKIRPGSVTDAPILARWEGMVRNIFGPARTEENRLAAEAGIQRLGGAGGATKEQAGDALVNSIRQGRVKFSQDMESLYGQVDALAGASPIIPTAPLKQQAQDILDALPKTAEGKTVGVKDALLQDILGMEDTISVRQAQRLRTMMREASETNDLVPDIGMHEARLMKNAVEQAFDAAKAGGGQNAAAVNALRLADARYKSGIQRFDIPAIAAITRDARYGGAVNADEVVDYLIRPDRVVRLRQVKNAASPQAWTQVREAHAQDLLQTVVRGTDDPLSKIFDGKTLRDSLDKYGRGVLEEVHGKQWVNSAYEYAHALMLAEKKMQLSGGIVAANVALHPVRNLPKLVWLRALSKVMEQPGTFKYLTDGIRLGPNTKAGAAALSRLTTQVTTLAKDETGSARFTITEPQ